MNYFLFSNKLKELHKSKDFDATITYFYENYQSVPKEKLVADEWTLWRIFDALKKQNLLSKSIQLIEWTSIKPDSVSKFLRDNIFWLIYKYVKQQEIYSKKIIQKLIKFADFDNPKMYNSIVFLIFRIVKKCDDHKLCNGMLDLIDYTKLRKTVTEKKIRIRGKEKNIEFASDFEKWISYKIKFLNKLNHLSEAAKFAKIGMTEISKLHYDNQIWFKRTILKSYIEEKKYQEAISGYKQIILKKKVWFLQAELAQIYLLIGDYKLAEKFAIDSFLNNGPLEMKVNLYLLLFDIFMTQNKDKEANEFALLSYLVRVEKKWKIPEKLTDINIENVSKNAKQLSGYLRTKYQNRWKDNRQIYEGIITMINTEKGFGFIKIKDGSNIYCKIKDMKFKNAKKGLKVKFNIIENFDAKKNKASQKAI
ncbi:MAG: cold shock domain-containing protein, partial [Candidatus Cloacimonadota bacterium]|nr:cold shock domain-containing protein [Candidatus Cloacimonadota bacterium]